MHLVRHGAYQRSARIVLRCPWRHLRVVPHSATTFGRRLRHTLSPTGSVRVPPPTWSCADLQLSEPMPLEHAALSPSLLSSLSRRALIPVTNDTSLHQELANMMRLIEQVVQWNQEPTNASLEPTASDLYDLPRGLVKAPLRSDEDEVLGPRENHPAVSLEKTVSIGGHKYFAVRTK